MGQSTRRASGHAAGFYIWCTIVCASLACDDGAGPRVGPPTDALPNSDTMASPDAAPEPDIGGRPGEGEPDAEVDAGPPPDAQVDSAECKEATQRPCPDAACPNAYQRCTEEGVWTERCFGPEELCNGVDDDCDGQVDETFGGLGEACTRSTGACASQGQRICTENGLGTECDATPIDPGNEVCNGIDDDCNGIVDDGPEGGFLSQDCYGGAAGTLGVGRCAGGVQFCLGGSWTECFGQATGGEESCNNVDDDCDGEVDEPPPELPVLMQLCYTAPLTTANVGTCCAGVQTCVNGEWEECRDDRTPIDEICDLLDNDCDGNTDEGLADCP
ncbi:MAG: MopE-related protein [Planctomycetota bacterium]|jgi:hypothetical protein